VSFTNLRDGDLYPKSLGHLEDLLSNHRAEVEREIPDIAEHLAAAIYARQKLMQ
jgi:hypothetical protein